MKLPPHRRDRYLRDSLPIRLGGLAANLARVASFIAHVSGRMPTDAFVVDSILNESKYFIEWCAPSAPIETASILVELQRALVRWQSRWSKANSDLEVRQELSRFAHAWSDQLLQMSSLLNTD